MAESRNNPGLSAWLPILVSFPVIVIIFFWNQTQARLLSEQWAEQEIREEAKERLAEFQPNLRSWLNEPEDLVTALASEPVLGVGLMTGQNWTFSPKCPLTDSWQEMAKTSSTSFQLLANGVGFLRLPLRAGPPSGELHPGRGRGFRWGNRFATGKNAISAQNEDRQEEEENRPFVRGPFQLVLLYQTSNRAPVWPFHLQSALWLIAWLIGSGMWLWVLQAQNRLGAMAIDRQREAHLAAVGRMSARLAHEIRNPLGMIRGAVQHLHGNPSASGSLEMLEMIEDESRRLERLTREVLDFCRPVDIHLTPVDLIPLLRSVQAQADLLAGFPKIALGPLPESDLVQADADSLRQVLLNLLQNAREASVSGNSSEAVQLEMESQPGQVIIRVIDHGPGLSPEAVEHLFEPFFSQKAKGFGLGLVISRRLVESMNGTLGLSNRVPRGCCAEVSLSRA
jgi:signal transduction histidine kinase